MTPLTKAELAQFEQAFTTPDRGKYPYSLDMLRLIAQAKRAVVLEAALRLAATRLEILTGRMRGCHEETGKHELLDEAEAFCDEARKALGGE